MTLHWIKGHNDNTGNEVADVLAKAGSKSTNRINTPMPEVEIKRGIEKLIENKWQKEWDKPEIEPKTGNIKYRHTKAIVKKVQHKKVTRNKFLSLPKNKLREIVSWVTGHCTLNKHLFIMEQQLGKDCRYCQEAEENPLHLILECKYLERERFDYINLQLKYSKTPIIRKVNNYKWELLEDKISQELVDLFLSFKNKLQQRLDNDFIT